MRSDKTCLQRALFAIVLCVFAHGLTCTSAQAQNLIDVPGVAMCRPNPAGATACGAGSGPASQSTTSTNTGAGNPINILNGNKYQREVDLPALPGELGLELVRHYNSSASHVVGTLGVGWRHSYESDLYTVGNTVQILQADGSRLIFNKDPANPSQCTGADPAQGWVQIITTPRGPEYIWHWTHGEAAGRQLRFSSKGKLENIRAPSGAMVILTRDPKGALMRVTDPQGRSLQFVWQSKAALAQSQQKAKAQNIQNALFVGVKKVITPVGEMDYEHGADAVVGTASQTPDAQKAQAANLRQVSYKESAQSKDKTVTTISTIKTYHYEDPRHSSHLTGISLQAGEGHKAGPQTGPGQATAQRLSSYAYDERGRGVLTQKGAISKEPGKEPGIEQVRISYPEPGLARQVGRTVVSNSQGAQTVYEHQVIAGQYKLLQVQGAGCAQCGQVNMRYGYDGQGRLIKQAQLSAVQVKDGQVQGQAKTLGQTQTDYDAQGRVVRITHSTGQGTTQSTTQSTTQWSRFEYGNPQNATRTSASWSQPTAVIRPSVVAGQEHRLELSYNEAGQITQVKETGWSPIDKEGQQTPKAQATRMERTTKYRYQNINERSVLVEVDGPLANGVKADPSDSDITRLDWDGKANYVVGLEQPGGVRSSLNYDEAGRIAQVQNRQGFTSRMRYNAQGQPIQISSQGPGWGQAQGQSLRYDAQGRPVESTRTTGPQLDTADSDPAQNQQAQWRQAYDEAGRLQWRASALGVLQQYQWDSESRLTQQGRYSNAMAQTKHYSYNAQGQLSGVSDNAGRSWSAERTECAAQPLRSEGDKIVQLQDDFGRTVLTQSPDHGRSTQSFDEANRLIHMRDAAGHSAHYAYNAQGRITLQSVTHAQSGQTQETRWHYNAQGQLVQIQHPTQSERYEYDERGLQTARIVTLQTGQGQHTSVTRYSHDAQGQLVASTLPDGSLVRYERNGQNQVTAVQRNPVRTPWLRWLGQEQTVVQDLARDLMGLKTYTTGNGVQAHYQRSQQGDLARVVYRRGGTQQTATQQRATHLSRSAQETIDLLLGVGLGVSSAHAADQPKAEQSKAEQPKTEQAKEQPKEQPGALGQPADPQALLDHRYLWDSRGNLLFTQSSGAALAMQGAQNTAQRRSSYAYDSQARLVAASSGVVNADSSTETTSRYAYDGEGRRVLSQQGIKDQSELKAGTQVQRYEAGSHRLQSANTTYTANGQPQQSAGRRMVWDAQGRLVQITDEQAQQSTAYAYDHRGLRTVKRVGAQTTYYLYDTGRQLQAELNGQGQLQRQYLYVADMALMVIDTPQGQALSEAGANITQQALTALQDIGTAVQSWFSVEAGMGELTWLHTNHLGAPEAATNRQGQLVWQAQYEAFGAALVNEGGVSEGRANEGQQKERPKFTLNLRLPGQYFDAETGLHYNRQRYYDPQAGQYLTPDPLGQPDGPNPYAYVAFNPLSNIDPDGLVLFAFDGTGNSDVPTDPAMATNGMSNVVRFRDAYSDKYRYVTGVGTVHRDDKYGNINPDDFAANTFIDWTTPSTPLFYNDMGGNYSGPARIDRMMLYIRDEPTAFYKENQNSKAMDIDIVGFSRGAAEARDFANRITQASTTINGKTYYRYKNDQGDTACQWVNFRFMGLWDTVISTNRSGYNYQLGIPAAFKFVSQAVALNEYRSGGESAGADATNIITSWDLRNSQPFKQQMGGFPLESIGGSRKVGGQVRVEMGFIGAHADIGGGYPESESQLSKVALNWMVGQAQIAGVKMNVGKLDALPTGPAVLHDQSNAIRIGNPVVNPKVPTSVPLVSLKTEDRAVHGAAAGTTQRTMGFGAAQTGGNRSMTNADTHAYITYAPRDPSYFFNAGGALDPKTLRNNTGSVDLQAYVQWLRNHGYVFAGMNEY